MTHLFHGLLHRYEPFFFFDAYSPSPRLHTTKGCLWLGFLRCSDTNPWPGATCSLEWGLAALFIRPSSKFKRALIYAIGLLNTRYGLCNNFKIRREDICALVVRWKRTWTELHGLEHPEPLDPKQLKCSTWCATFFTALIKHLQVPSSNPTWALLHQSSHHVLKRTLTIYMSCAYLPGLICFGYIDIMDLCALPGSEVWFIHAMRGASPPCSTLKLQLTVFLEALLLSSTPQLWNPSESNPCAVSLPPGPLEKMQ